MKIPTRPMFWCQVIASIVAGTVQLGVQAWIFTLIECVSLLDFSSPSPSPYSPRLAPHSDLCSATQKDGFICPNTEVFDTAFIIWAVIGPQRQFSSGQVYCSDRRSADRPLVVDFGWRVTSISFIPPSRTSLYLFIYIQIQNQIFGIDLPVLYRFPVFHGLSSKSSSMNAKRTTSDTRSAVIEPRIPWSCASIITDARLQDLTPATQVNNIAVVGLRHEYANQQVLSVSNMVSQLFLSLSQCHCHGL